MKKDVLIVRNIPKGVTKDEIEMRFGLAKFSGGNGDVEFLEVTEGAACLQFESDQGLKIMLQVIIIMHTTKKSLYNLYTQLQLMY